MNRTASILGLLGRIHSFLNRFWLLFLCLAAIASISSLGLSWRHVSETAAVWRDQFQKRLEQTKAHLRQPDPVIRQNAIRLLISRDGRILESDPPGLTGLDISITDLFHQIRRLSGDRYTVLLSPDLSDGRMRVCFARQRAGRYEAAGFPPEDFFPECSGSREYILFSSASRVLYSSSPRLAGIRLPPYPVFLYEGKVCFHYSSALPDIPGVHLSILRNITPEITVTIGMLMLLLVQLILAYLGTGRIGREMDSLRSDQLLLSDIIRKLSQALDQIAESPDQCMDAMVDSLRLCLISAEKADFRFHEIREYRLMLHRALDRLADLLEKARRDTIRLSRNEKKFRSLFEAMLEGVFLLELIPSTETAARQDGSPPVIQDYRFLSLNPSAERILGQRAENLIGLPASRVFGSPPPFLDEFSSVVRERRPQSFEADLPLKQRNLPAFISAFPMEDHMLTAVVHDMSSVQEAQAERNRLEEQLIQSQKIEAVGSLAGGIAHDFNNILGVILGYGELAVMKLREGEPAVSDVEEVLKASERARRLVRQILSFSRPSSGKYGPVHLPSIIEETVKMMRASLPPSIEIRFDGMSSRAEPPENPDIQFPSVTGDETQLHQVFMNICTNAGRAMAETGGVLRIGLSHEAPSQSAKGRYWCVRISDTGTGMDDAVKERIFDPFFTTRQGGEGTGLGLSVVHGIVRKHGGMIQVESRPGEGSTFHVYLPAEERDGGTKDHEKERRIPMNGSGERILVVDDEDELLTVMTSILTSMGYRAVSRACASEALGVFLDGPNDIDLVLSDMHLPDMSGLELMAEMRKIRPGLPFILCSGNQEFQKKRESGRSGAAPGGEADFFLSKPIPMDKLGFAIRKVLEDRRPQRSPAR